MKHAKRTKIGEALIDVSKYILTVGLIGGIITDKITVTAGIIFLIATIIIGFIGLITMPPEKDG